MRLLAKLKVWSELGKDFWILSLSALVANSLNAGFAQYLYLYLTKELGASYDLAALVISVSLVAFLLLLPLGGRAVHVWGRKPFLVLSPAVACIASLLLAVAPDWRLALTALVIGYAPLSFSGPAMYSYIGDVVPAARLGTAYGTFNSVLAAGSVIGLPAVGVMISVVGYRATLLAVAASSLAAAVVRLLLRRVGGRGGRVLSKEVFTTFIKPFRVKGIASVLAFAALYYALSYEVSIVALPVLLNEVYGIGEAMIGIIIAVSNVVYSLAAPLGGRAVDLHDLRVLSTLQLGLRGAFIALLTVTGSPPLLVAIWAADSAASVFILPSVESVIAARSGEERAQAFAAYGFARNLLTTFLTYPIGLLITALWFPVTMYVLAALMVGLIPIALVTMPRKVKE